MMRKMTNLTILMVLVLMVGLSSIYAVPAIAVGSEWHLAFQGAVGFSVNFMGFITEKNGIAVGPDGKCHYTEDGGKTWPQANNKSQCRYGMDVLDDATAYSCGAGGNIRFAKDAGKNWDERTSTEGGTNFISFCDVMTGWTGSEGNTLFATIDGGKQWSSIDTPGQPNPMSGIALLSPTSGYVLIQEPESSVLYLTEDGGKSWQKQSVVCEGTLFGSTIRFFDSKQGVIIGYTKGKLQSFNTGDGGKTWRSENIIDKGGLSFLTRDGKFLTLLGFDNVYYVFTKQ